MAFGIKLSNASISTSLKEQLEARVRDWSDISSLPQSVRDTYRITSSPHGGLRLPNGEELSASSIRANLANDQKTLLLAYQPTGEKVTTVLTLQLGPEREPIVTLRELYGWGDTRYSSSSPTGTPVITNPEGCSGE